MSRKRKALYIIQARGDFMEVDLPVYSEAHSRRVLRLVRAIHVGSIEQSIPELRNRRTWAAKQRLLEGHGFHLKVTIFNLKH